jgi:hypothetical protein
MMRNPDMKYRFIDRPDLAVSQLYMESACHCARAYDNQLRDYLDQYATYGNFPNDAKYRLRNIANTVTLRARAAHSHKPSRVRRSTIDRLGQEIATRDGSGNMYGPRPIQSNKES